MPNPKLNEMICTTQALFVSFWSHNEGNTCEITVEVKESELILHGHSPGKVVHNRLLKCP